MKMMSDNINELITALCKARAEFAPIRKSKRANYGEYADTNDILSVVVPVLSKYGLFLNSFHHTTEAGYEAITAIISHSSGQWMKSECYMRPNLEKDAMWGGCITFRVRYLYKNLLGLSVPDDVEDDDDGHAVITQQEYEYLSSLSAGFQVSIKERNKIDDLRLLPRSQFQAIYNHVEKQRSKQG